MAQLLDETGYQSTDQPEDAQLLIVNTCGFIGPARAESMQALRELAASKTAEQRLIAAGCLSQRYGYEIVKEVPGIDGILGTRRWMDIVDVIEKMQSHKSGQPLYHIPEASAESYHK